MNSPSFFPACVPTSFLGVAVFLAGSGGLLLRSKEESPILGCGHRAATIRLFRHTLWSAQEHCNEKKECKK